jgi:acyl-CoA synthetase (AMP-forming)/AMP-acid ligase II
VEVSEDAPRRRELVSVGSSIGQLVRIVRNGQSQPDGTVGEIWVHGPHVATGYWRRPNDSFDAVLDGLGGWLRTGDLGVRHRGELYLTGRIKDLIVVDGRNFYPQDIEATAGEAHPAVRHDRVAAFGVSDAAGEGAVVVAEWARGVDSDTVDAELVKEVKRAVLRAVSLEHALTLRTVHLVGSGALPRTSSGKVARSAAKAALR